MRESGNAQVPSLRLQLLNYIQLFKASLAEAELDAMMSLKT